MNPIYTTSGLSTMPADDGGFSIIATSNDETIIQTTSTATSPFPDDSVIIITALIVCVAIILSIINTIHSANTNGLILFDNMSDQFNSKIILIIAFKVCDVITDIAVLAKIASFYAHIHDKTISFLLLCSILSLLFSYGINLSVIRKIMNFQYKTEGPIIWFSQYIIFFIFLVCVTCDSYLSVQLISSNIFAINLFNSGHSIIELKKIEAVKILSILSQVNHIFL